MSPAEQSERDRKRALAEVIRKRPKVGRPTAIILSLLFALAATPIVLADEWLEPFGALDVSVGGTAPVTFRVAQFSGFSDPVTGIALDNGPIVVSRGEVLDRVLVETIGAVRSTAPHGLPAWIAYALGLFVCALLFTTHMRRSHRGRLLRTQLVTLGLIAGVAGAVKAALLLTAISPLAVPVAAIALAVTMVIDLSVGLAAGLVASVMIGLTVPFDPGVFAVLGAQAVVAVMLLGETKKHRSRHILVAGLGGAAAAAVVYLVFYYLTHRTAPVHELATPLTSAWLAAAAGGLLSAFIVFPVVPIYQLLLGDITKNRLVELEDLSNPLLRQIAENAPGTWQHSLAMANMAELAANAIGANGRLVRVGAYYHDLGKSLQPKYFVENLEAGEPSPHDNLAPEVSCDAIFAHVTEGIVYARKHGLPERIVDFMHMHHGNGVLEYFWSKYREQGANGGLKEENFRYPGIPPQSRETAILAVVDAVEAASRTLKTPDETAIKNLVQRIVYGKLHLGQLDESGLSMADLRMMSDSLRDTIKHAHHGRIEYPWQKAEREAAAKSAADKAATTTGNVRASTSRVFDEPRLDSLDVPRPLWRDRASTSQPIDTRANRSAKSNGQGRASTNDATADTLALARPNEPASPAEGTSSGKAATVATPAPVAQTNASVEAAPVEAAPVEAAPVEAAPVEAAPVEAAPVEPAPVEAAPVEAAPVEPAPVEPAPVEPAPVEPAPVEAAPVEAAPFEPATVESAPVEPATVEATPVEAAPVESAPVETAPVEAAPVETAPVETAPPDETNTAEAATRPHNGDPTQVSPRTRPAHDTQLAALSRLANEMASKLPSRAETAAQVVPKKAPPPPPGSSLRPSRITIPVDEDLEIEDDEITVLSRESQPRADTADDLPPGVIVVGPPPATKPSAAGASRRGRKDRDG